MPEISFKTVASFVTVVIVIGCILLLSKPGFDLESVLYFNEDTVETDAPTTKTFTEAEVENSTEKSYGRKERKEQHTSETVCPEVTLASQPTKDKLDPALQHAVFRDLRPFLLATPSTVTGTLPPLFLTDVKNPCFALDKNYINVGNINLTTAIRLKYEVRCLPGVYLAGFSKCGTTDFHSSLVRHQLLYGIATTRKLDKYSQHIWASNYRNVKESHFWDNRHCGHNRTLDSLSKLCMGEGIVHAYKKFGELPYNPNKRDDFRGMLFIESTPAQAWSHDSWHEEQVHYNRAEPKEFTPDRIHHSTPRAKIIFLVRDPVARTFSDYCYLTSKKAYHSSEDLHRKVMDAMSWWKNCTAVYPQGACAYGPAPIGMPFHMSPSCGQQNQMKLGQFCSDYKYWGCGNAIDRFRISLYHVYLSEWIRAFGSQNVLVVKSEEMFADRIASMNRIYEFLGLPEMRKDILDELLQKTNNSNKSKQYITMSNETRDALEEFFEPENLKLAQLLGLEKPFW